MPRNGGRGLADSKKPMHESCRVIVMEDYQYRCEGKMQFESFWLQ